MFGKKLNWESFFLEVLGSLLVAVSIYNFAAAAEFPMTGFSGIALILYRLFRIPLGLSNVLLNIPVVILCFRMLGKGFFLRSVRCMVISSLLMDYVAPLLPVFTGNRMLAAICTGVLGGVGYALIYMQNSSTGGADFLIMALKAKKPYLPLGNITFLFAVSVIGDTWLIFGDTEGVIYGLIINYLAGAVINKTMYGRNAGKMTMIITKDGKKISDGIEDCCHRGSTIIPVMGGYRQEKKYAVLCVCNNKQMFEITQQVKRLDPESFMIIWESNEVHGDGFKALTIGEK